MTCDVGQDETQAIPEFSREELETEISNLKSKKAGDTSGVVAEMVKQGGDMVVSALLNLCSQIILPNATPPTTWKHTVMKVLFKSGNPQLPNNYRPISVIPILYKIFARLIYKRLQPTLDSQQTVDQAGFRPDYSTLDHLFAFTCIEEKTSEFNQK
eukprot:9446397-Karenia_brevis.AAC.1